MLSLIKQHSQHKLTRLMMMLEQHNQPDQHELLNQHKVLNQQVLQQLRRPLTR